MRPKLHMVAGYGESGSSARVRLYDWVRHTGVPAIASNYANRGNNNPGTILRHPYSSFRAELRTRRLKPAADALIISREASPFSSGDLEVRLLRQAPHSVYDLDDAVYLSTGGVRTLLRTDQKSQRSAKAADVVIAGSEVLADWASTYAKDVRVIPSCVEPSHYAPKQSWEQVSEAGTLVWLGSPATEAYLATIAEALLEIHRRTGATLKVISGERSNPGLHALEGIMRRVPWHQNSVARELETSDVAIAPLPDIPFARGKCAYKLLQYAASALPIVGSPVGANRSALERFDGVQVHSQEEWVDAVTMLLTKGSKERERRGRSALRGVNENYSFAVWREEWLQAVGLCASDSHPLLGGPHGTR